MANASTATVRSCAMVFMEPPLALLYCQRAPGVVPAKAGTQVSDVVPAKAGIPLGFAVDACAYKRVARPVKQPVVHILASQPYGTLYVGVTSNLAERIEAPSERLRGCIHQAIRCPYSRLLRGTRRDVRGDSKGKAT